jgi:putative tryptophan/tyrosine transport system substrate-binding protein
MNRRDTMFALVVLSASTLPCASLAQQPGKVWRVGFLSLISPSLSSQNTDAFRKRMQELGYVAGKNLVMEWRFADGNLERLPGLAAELVQLKVDVIVAAVSSTIAAAQKATTTIPIVMVAAGDPVGSGFVKTLARPGGNITGLSTLGGDRGAKLFDLLRSVVPKLSRVALLTPTMTYGAVMQSIQSAAQKAGVKTLQAEASTPQEIDNAFATMAREKADAVIVGSPTLSSTGRSRSWHSSTGCHRCSKIGSMSTPAA